MAGHSRLSLCALLAVWAGGISGDARAYSVNIISSAVSVDVMATAGNDSETAGKSASRVAGSVADAAEANGFGQVAASVGFGQAILVAGGLQIRTVAQTNVRSRADGPMTGSALSDVSAQITFSVDKRANETLPLLLRLETELTLYGSLIGQGGLEGVRFVFTLENLTKGKTLYDSRLVGYPDFILLPGLVGDVFKISYLGSLKLAEAARPFEFGLEIQSTRLIISGTAIPEPGTAVLAAFGLAALGRLGRRRPPAAAA